MKSQKVICTNKVSNTQVGTVSFQVKPKTDKTRSPVVVAVQFTEPTEADKYQVGKEYTISIT